MKLRTIITTVAASAMIPAIACTSLIAAPGATTDGSVMITYAADSHTLYGELYSQPAADHADGAMRQVVEWDTGKLLGSIPEVKHTYATIGNMNEHGLTISESTWGGREELVDTNGVVDYGSLIYIALQRAKNAREAIDVMTSLVRDHGYASSGESFSIADPNEVWIMEMIGKGPQEKGAVWVARRVPDDCISGHANHSRIHQFPLNEPATTIYSPDVIDFAKSKGYYTGPDSLFSFSKAYAPADMGALRGCDGRVWSYYNRFAPVQSEHWLPWVLRGEGDPLPLWIKPRTKVGLKDMQNMMRDHFEGTPMDMTKDVGAGSWDVPYRWRPLTYEVDSVEYTHERAIATQQTGFSFVAQMRKDVPAPMRGILWFGVDDANTCSYVPIYCCVTEAPHCFAPGNGDMLTLSWDAAFWVHNYVANQVYNRYSVMIPDVRRVQTEVEDKMIAEAAATEKRVATLPEADQRRELAALSNRLAEESTKRFKELGDYLLVKYIDGNVKREDAPGKFSRTPEGMPVSPEWPGYDEQYYRSIVKDTDGHLRVIEIKQ